MSPAFPVIYAIIKQLLSHKHQLCSSSHQEKSGRNNNLEKTNHIARSSLSFQLKVVPNPRVLVRKMFGTGPREEALSRATGLLKKRYFLITIKIKKCIFLNRFYH